MGTLASAGPSEGRRDVNLFGKQVASDPIAKLASWPRTATRALPRPVRDGYMSGSRPYG